MTSVAVLSAASTSDKRPRFNPIRDSMLRRYSVFLARKDCSRNAGEKMVTPMLSGSSSTDVNTSSVSLFLPSGPCSIISALTIRRLFPRSNSPLICASLVLIRWISPAAGAYTDTLSGLPSTQFSKGVFTEISPMDHTGFGSTLTGLSIAYLSSASSGTSTPNVCSDSDLYSLLSMVRYPA